MIPTVKIEQVGSKFLAIIKDGRYMQGELGATPEEALGGLAQKVEADCWTYHTTRYWRKSAG